jgi:hypothetical protein
LSRTVHAAPTCKANHPTVSLAGGPQKKDSIVLLHSTHPQREWIWGTSNGGLVAIWIRGRRRWSSTGTATDGTPPLRATHSITHYSSHPQPSIAIVEGSHWVLFPGPVSVGVGGHERLRRSGVLLRTALLLQRTWLASRPALGQGGTLLTADTSSCQVIS